MTVAQQEVIANYPGSHAEFSQENNEWQVWVQHGENNFDIVGFGPTEDEAWQKTATWLSQDAE